MASPAYTTDLVDITTAEDTTGWVVIGGGNIQLGAGIDFAMQGINGVDGKISNTEKGMGYSTSPQTLAANDHIFTWTTIATPGLIDTLVNRGLAVVAGTGSSQYNKFHVEGNDTLGATGRSSRCYPIRYDTTANTGSAPYRTLTGNPGATPSFFGVTANITSTVKGSNLSCDAIRRGTGIYITAGDVATPATFNDSSAEDNAKANRWGVLIYLAGSAYELQGRFVVGQDNTGTPSPAYFEDSNKTITLVDTPHSLSDFTQIIVDHATSVFKLTNITIEAAGTHNKGALIFNDSGTVGLLERCNFVKIGITTLRAGVTVIGSSWRGAEQVTPNGATITGFDLSASADPTGGIAVSSPAEMALITGGTLRDNAIAIKITASGNYELNGHQFSGNTVQVDFTGTGTCTINPTNGCNVTQANCTASGGGTIVVNEVQKTFSFNVLNSQGNPHTGYEWRIYEPDPSIGIIGLVELAGEEVAVSSSQTYTYSHSGEDIPVVVQILDEPLHRERTRDIVLSVTDQTITINLDAQENI